MYKQKLAMAALLLISFNAINAQSLQRSLPEAEGVSSKAIAEFADSASASKSEFHSFMVLRHGKVIAEGWWNPYRADLKHTMYSCSKSFTATAIGFAVQEKLLSVNDKVTSFFPQQLPDTVSHNLSDLTVKDVLMMSDGMDPDPTFKIAKDTDWVKSFLSTEIKYDPGTVFLYNSLGTYMLSAIIQKVTGMQLIEYLKPRLFTPLGITGIDWETDSKGINTGGWGLRLKTEDMAKFAQFFLNKGKWNGKQLLNEEWIKDASSMQIMQKPNATQQEKDSNEWVQGYCYQMWRCRYNAFRGDGAFGQYIIMMPDQDAAVLVTAETSNMQEEINLVWKYLLPAFGNKSLPADKKANELMQQKLKALSLPLPVKTNSTNATITGKTFAFDSAAHLKTITLSFDDKNICHAKLETDTVTYDLTFSNKEWLTGETKKAGPSLTGGAIENIAFLFPAKVAGSYAWKDDQTLQLVLRYIESPHRETYTCHFNGDKLVVDYEKSLDFGTKKLSMTASAK